MPGRHLTLVCEDVNAGATFFRDVLALPVRQRDGRRAEVELGTVTATLTTRDQEAAQGATPATKGEPVPGSGPAVIVELEVEDVVTAVRELRRRGATVLVDPVVTDWGTESAFVAGPDGVIVEVYRLRVPPRPPWLTDDAD